MRALRLASALLGACAIAACTTTGTPPGQPDGPPASTSDTPFAGVTDARRPFAALFAAELGTDDTATAWLHHGVPNAGPAAVPAALAARFAARAPTTSVLVVPGLFGDCVETQSVPFGDGIVRPRERSRTEAYRQYDDLGLRSIRMVPLPGRASAADNGRLLQEEIRAEAAQPGVRRIVLVAYSKGLPDLLHALPALRDDGALLNRLAVVSVAGAVMGTPLADRFEAVYEAVSPWVNPLDCTDSRGGDLASLTRRERVAWWAAHPLPAGPAYYSVVARATVDEVAPGLRLTAAELAAIDPRNDGQLIVFDALLPGSVLLAEVHADHWAVALPLDAHPNPLLRAMATGRGFPREALFRAVVRWAVGAAP